MTHPQHLLAIAGVPGSGKTTLAIALAEQLSWHRLSRDDLRARGFGQQSAAAGKALAWLQILNQLPSLLGKGASVIVEGMPFSRASERDQLAALASKHHAYFHLLWLDCPLDLAKARIRNGPAHSAPDRNVGLVDAVAARFEPLPPAAYRLDGEQSPSQVLNQAATWVAARLLSCRSGK